MYIEEKEVMVIKEGESYKKIEVTPLYTRLFGESKNANVYLGILNINRKIIPRYRDCLLIKIGDEFRFLIYTRTGGSNRVVYDSENTDNLKGPWNSCLRGHEYYLSDEDCRRDSTYANFYFKIPSDYLDYVIENFSDKSDKIPSERWDYFFKVEMKNLKQNDPKFKEIVEKLSPYASKNLEFKTDNEVCKKFRDI